MPDRTPPVLDLDVRDTHRLIPARYADGGASVLARLTDNDDVLSDIFELDNATNYRLAAEEGHLPGMDARELVFGIPRYRIINAAFCHPSPTGSRFNSSDRGAWYSAFELETSQQEVAYHKQKLLQETGWDEPEISDYVDYLADFHAAFHDIRGNNAYADCLHPDSYVASQALAAQLLAAGSSGIVYPSVRQSGGTCIVCFRPVLVGNVRFGNTIRFTFPNSTTPAIMVAL